MCSGKKKTLGVSDLRGGWGLPYLFCTMCICSFYICSCLHTCRCRLKDREHEDKRGKKAELLYPRRPHPRCPPAAAARSPQPAPRTPAAPQGCCSPGRAYRWHKGSPGSPCCGCETSELGLELHAARASAAAIYPRRERGVQNLLPPLAACTRLCPLPPRALLIHRSPPRWVTARWVTSAPERMDGWTDTRIHGYTRIGVLAENGQLITPPSRPEPPMLKPWGVWRKT